MKKQNWYSLMIHTKGVSSSNWSMLCCGANAKLILSKDSEDVILESNQVGCLVCGLFNSGRELVPDLTVCGLPLNNVVGYFRATIVTRGIPGQEARMVCDLRNIKSSRWSRLVWRTKIKLSN